MNYFRNAPGEYIKFVNHTKKEFIQNLSNMEWRRIGLKTEFILPGADRPISTIFQTNERWSNFFG